MNVEIVYDGLYGSGEKSIVLDVERIEQAKQKFFHIKSGVPESNIRAVREVILPVIVAATKRSRKTNGGRKRDTWSERVYATLLDFRDVPQTKDAILARMNKVFELNSAQHNNVAPTFSPGNGGLWDERRVVLVSRKAGVTRTGSAADEWVADDFATSEQIAFSDAEWQLTMEESLQDMKQLLVELPAKIAVFERSLEQRKNPIPEQEMTSANNN